jgi:hypothetical protein
MEPNPPFWPPSVQILRSSDTDIERKLSAAADSQGHGGGYTTSHHFSERRIALLFAPGVYKIAPFQVGYYAQVLGLGITPDEVMFVNKCDDSDDNSHCFCGPFVCALNQHLHHHGSCLDTFWRSAEIFSTSCDLQWAVSQAAPLRRVHVGGDLHLSQGSAYASGGFMANVQVDGVCDFYGQQQWASRNCQFQQGIKGGAWSLVFVGCGGNVPQSAEGSDKSPAISIQKETPVRVEKPFVAMRDDGTFELRVPQMTTNDVGTFMDGSMEDVRDFSKVFVAHAGQSGINNSIQTALDDGKDVVLSPGLYILTDTLQMKTTNQVILGLGLATLISPADGSPCIHVASNTAGIRIAGIMLEASPHLLNNVCRVMLDWGSPNTEAKNDASNDSNNNHRCNKDPGALLDIFCRVGGTAETRQNAATMNVGTMIRLHSSHVVGDNLWLWRADHAELVPEEEANCPNVSSVFYQTEQYDFRTQTGLEVLGDDITIYGLAVEHMIGHQTIWRGERGAVYFYQCELPYCVSQETFGDKDYCGYLVNESVKDHTVMAAGVYSNFRNHEVKVKTAFQYPPGTNHINLFTVHLNNHGTISSIANGKGGATIKRGVPMRLTNSRMDT